LCVLNGMVAPDAARKVAAGAKVICGPVSLPDPSAAYPLVARRNVVANSPTKTDRDLSIPNPLSDVLIHDQSSNRPLRDGHWKRHKKRHTASIVALLLHL
jgi:hypothetical protein